jgi:TPR repeat protein
MMGCSTRGVISTLPPPPPPASIQPDAPAAGRVPIVVKRCVEGDTTSCDRIERALQTFEADVDVAVERSEPLEPEDTAVAPSEGEAEQEFRLGERLLDDPSPSRLGAPEHLKRACDLDHGSACNALGWAWSTGFGTLKADGARARALYERACELGSATGCLNRARHARAAEDLGGAAKWASQACSGELRAGCEVLAGVLQEAESSCRTSAKTCHDWGYILEFGYGVPEDSVKGLAAHERSCAAGSSVGCWSAGVSYRDGITGDPHPAKAKARFKVACAAGLDAACLELNPR